MQVEIAENLEIPVDEAKGIHLEYDSYAGQKIKQADVVLLGFPLMYPMSTTMRRNDLVYYAARTDPNVCCCVWRAPPSLLLGVEAMLTDRFLWVPACRAPP